MTFAVTINELRILVDRFTPSVDPELLARRAVWRAS
jgi:hypothetical protein